MGTPQVSPVNNQTAPTNSPTAVATGGLTQEQSQRIHGLVQEMQACMYGGKAEDYGVPEDWKSFTFLLIDIANTLGYFELFEPHDTDAGLAVVTGFPSVDRAGNPAMNSKGRQAYATISLVNSAETPLPAIMTKQGALVPKRISFNVALWGLGRGGSATRDKAIVRSQSTIENKLQAAIAAEKDPAKADALRQQLNTVRQALSGISF